MATISNAQEDARKDAAKPQVQPAQQREDKQRNEDAKPKEDSAKPDWEKAFLDEVQEIKNEIAELEHKFVYGEQGAKEYAVELEQEYKTLAEQLPDNAIEDYSRLIPTERQTVDRLHAVSSTLWFVRFVVQQTRNDRDEARAIQGRIRDLLHSNSEIHRNPQHMRTYHDLSRKASDLSNSIMMSRHRSCFHFAKPTETETGPANAFADDAKLQYFRTPISRLLRLQWEGGLLKLDADHWNQPFAAKSLSQIDAQVTAELTSRKVELPDEDRTFDYQKKRYLEAEPVFLLFQNLQQVASDNPMRTIASAFMIPNAKKLKFTSGNFDAALEKTEQQFSFYMRELTTTEQQIMLLRYNTDNELLIRIIGDRFVQLEQHPDGKVRWVDIAEEAKILEADSFAELYSQHPDVIEQDFVPHLRSYGILPPITRFNLHIGNRIIEMLKHDSANARDEFEQLLKKMESGSFGQRQNAFRQLSENVDRFSIMLDEIELGDIDSAEVVARIQEIQKKTNIGDKEIDKMILRTGLLDDQSYLRELLSRVSEINKSVIEKRLDELTQADSPRQ
ncbi:hypothetical protein ACMFWY_00060 [Roseiconus sp. JC912]